MNRDSWNLRGNADRPRRPGRGCGLYLTWACWRVAGTTRCLGQSYRPFLAAGKAKNMRRPSACASCSSSSMPQCRAVDVGANSVVEIISKRGEIPYSSFLQKQESRAPGAVRLSHQQRRTVTRPTRNKSALDSVGGGNPEPRQASFGFSEKSVRFEIVT